MNTNDTIAAVATPSGEGGIGIVRISGPESLSIADKIFIGKEEKSVEKFKSYTAHYGKIINPQTSEPVDEVILIVMRKPKSYTCEDVVEIDCHGGIVPLEMIVELAVENGARIAEPGEFTKRAFLNGRLDLTQAEAVIDVIRSKTDKSLQSAFSLLEGKLSDEINNARKKIIEVLSVIEVNIDFTDEDDQKLNYPNLEMNLKKALKIIEELIQSGKKGRILREGVKTVIVGKPNVGKSSLMNALLRENRAIVTDIPGTTRDMIEEVINIRGIPLRIVDTAGLRDTEEIVEKIGVEKTKESLKTADLVLLVLDAADSLDEQDIEIMEMVKGFPVITVINKIDLEKTVKNEKISEIMVENPVKVSALERDGLEGLEEEIYKKVLGSDTSEETFFINRLRHRNALKDAEKALKNALETLKALRPSDLVSIDLNEALEALGRITGETVSEDLLEHIFSEFCVGK